MEAVAPEVKDAVSIVRNRRSDAMFVCAYIAVICIIYLVVYQKDISEYAQGVLTLALGNFIGYLTGMYNFETGTTRSAAKKDDTITALTATAAATATTAQAIQVASDVAAAGAPTPPAPAAPIQADAVKIDAKNVTVDQPQKGDSSS